MKNKTLLGEVLLSFLLIALASLCLRPLEQMWMPTMYSSLVLLALAIVFIFLTIFIWKENVRDERENQHRLMAGRFGFLVGAGILVAGIIIQTIHERLDSWLLVALVAMILAKICGHLYYQSKN